LAFADSFCTNTVRYSGQVGLTIAMLDSGYDNGDSGSDVLDGAEVYATIKDDFYLTVTQDYRPYDTYDDALYSEVPYDADVVDLLYHDVELHPNANFYQEPQEVNVLVLRHYLGPNVGVEIFHNGELITADIELIIEERRVEIRLPMAMSVAVLLTSNQPS